MTVSKNGIALILFLASVIGLTVTESQLVDVISALTQIISFGLMIWNQLSRKDVKGFLFKK